MKRVLEILFSGFVWVIGLVTFFLWALFILIIGVFFQGSVFEKSVRFGCKLIMFIMGIQVSTRNQENYDYKKQYIVMMNHVNMFDPFMIYACFKGRARGIEEESHFKWPVYGWVIRRIGHIPISRKKGRKAIESLKKAVRLIKSKKGISVVILPEGARTLDGKLGKFKKGGFLLALESGLDILPVIQRGSYRIKRRENWIIKPGKVECIFERPISTKTYTKDNINDLIKETRNIFLKYVE